MDQIVEAIKYFEDAIKETDEILEECSEALRTELSTQKDQFIKAVKALEKQLPMKIASTDFKFKAVDVDTQEIHMYEASHCPSCEKWITKIYKYCPHCGQRIKNKGEPRGD